MINLSIIGYNLNKNKIWVFYNKNKTHDEKANKINFLSNIKNSLSE